MSEIFNLGLSFCFIDSRNTSLENDRKLPFFLIE